MDEAKKVRIASALFNAQNALTLEWQNRNTGSQQDLEAQDGIEKVQAKIRMAIRELGGVDYLCSIGA